MGSVAAGWSRSAVLPSSWTFRSARCVSDLTSRTSDQVRFATAARMGISGAVFFLMSRVCCARYAACRGFNVDDAGRVAGCPIEFCFCSASTTGVRRRRKKRTAIDTKKNGVHFLVGTKKCPVVFLTFRPATNKKKWRRDGASVAPSPVMFPFLGALFVLQHGAIVAPVEGCICASPGNDRHVVRRLQKR